MSDESWPTIVSSPEADPSQTIWSQEGIDGRFAAYLHRGGHDVHMLRVFDVLNYRCVEPPVAYVLAEQEILQGLDVVHSIWLRKKTLRIIDNYYVNSTKVIN